MKAKTFRLEEGGRVWECDWATGAKLRDLGPVDDPATRVARVADMRATQRAEDREEAALQGLRSERGQS